MAEQAINTIYALGNHPDQIIKKFNRRVFTGKLQPPAPDTPVDKE